MHNVLHWGDIDIERLYLKSKLEEDKLLAF